MKLILKFVQFKLVTHSYHCIKLFLPWKEFWIVLIKIFLVCEQVILTEVVPVEKTRLALDIPAVELLNNLEGFLDEEAFNLELGRCFDWIVAQLVWL